MRVLYFGIYDPDYSRNRVLIKGLRLNGAEVLECNDRSKGALKYIKLIFKYFSLKNKFDVMVVGFPGQEVMFLARILTRKPIVFDVFTSHYGGHVLDRKKHATTSLKAKWYRWLDKKSVNLTDISLLDTNAHIDFFVKEFNLPKEKFKRIFVGADSSVFYPQEDSKRHESFLVHFHGHFIPLQGTQRIIEAAKLLEADGVVFNIIGRGQDYKKGRDLAERLNARNINFIDNVPYGKLRDYISEADICLGIFGETLKADIVIPNKVYEAIACAKPVITADTPAIRELFTDEKDALLSRKDNAKDLADKILLLKNNSELRDQIARGGYDLFKAKLTEEKLGAEAIAVLRKFNI